MPEPFLRCALDLKAGSLSVAAHFDLWAPWTTLFGPSGCGKTTVLRALAGHLRPIQGRLQLRDGTVLSETGSEQYVAAHRRPVRTAPQQPRALPGSVQQNMRYGVQHALEQGVENSVLELFMLAPLLRRPAATLSGGELQRLSLARTVLSALGAQSPVALLLLDEPFTGLDLAVRDQLAPRLRTFLGERQLPVLSVTHDVPEALMVSDEVLRMEAGHLLARGPAMEVLAPERAQLLRTLTVNERAIK